MMNEIRDIKILTGLNLKNIYGLNVFRHTKDKNVKRKAVLLLICWIILIVMAAGYTGALSLGFIQLGMAEAVPAYLIMIASLIILAFGLFKSGSVIFSEKGYEILSSLPVSASSIVISRFIRMYVENLIFTAVVMIPGLTIYAWNVKPAIGFYIISILVYLVLPVMPMIAAAAFGTLITAISSRMKHKSLVNAGLSVLLVVAILAASGRVSQFEGELNEEMLSNLGNMVTDVIGQVYPPAVWMGYAVTGNTVIPFILWMAVSMGMFVLMIMAVSAGFHSICRGLYSTSAKHDFSLDKGKGMAQRSVLTALYKKELKRYLASSIYVTNTVIGPVMGLVMAIGIFAGGLEMLENALMVPLDISGLIPFLFAAVFTMMPTSSVSISMEGKEWWIIKSLPVKTKTVLDSKILLNLSLQLPFLAASEVLLWAALKPAGTELLWLIAIPLVLIIFSSVFGLTVNLKLPSFDWENETSVVKQSASSAVGGLGSMVISLICGVIYAVSPAEWRAFINAAICGVLAVITALLYWRNSRIDLKNL